jgi:hypothetical protein
MYVCVRACVRDISQVFHSRISFWPMRSARMHRGIQRHCLAHCCHARAWWPGTYIQFLKFSVQMWRQEILWNVWEPSHVVVTVSKCITLHISSNLCLNITSLKPRVDRIPFVEKQELMVDLFMITTSINKPITTYILFTVTVVHCLTTDLSGNILEFMNCWMKQFVSTTVSSIKSQLKNIKKTATMSCCPE